MEKIDCLGDMCPIPVLKAKKALKKIKSGERLMVVSDHSCVLESFVNTFKKCDIEYIEVINGVWEIYLTKP